MAVVANVRRLYRVWGSLMGVAHAARDMPADGMGFGVMVSQCFTFPLFCFLLVTPVMRDCTFA